MPLRLLTTASFVLAAILVAVGVAAATPAAAAEGHASAAGKGKRAHAHHRHHRKHKRKHHRRTRHTGATSAPAGGGPTTSSGAGAGAGSGTTTSTTTRSSGASAPVTITAQAASCPGAGVQPSAANVPTVRAAVLCLVNQQRTAAGVAPLVDNGSLDAAAQGHSDDMVARAFFDHTNPSGASFADRISATGYVFNRAAENIAWGGGALGTPAQIVAGWMNSPGHRANILDGALAESGIGVNPGLPGGGAGGTYTQDFGTR